MQKVIEIVRVACEIFPKCDDGQTETDINIHSAYGGCIKRGFEWGGEWAGEV